MDSSFDLYIPFQLEEIEEHRYYLGQKFGRPVSDDEVIHDWMDSGHSERFRDAYKAHLEVIRDFAAKHDCGRDFRKEITPEVVHELLED